MARFLVQSLRDRLGSTADVEVTGRRLRLAAANSDDLGRALAKVLGSGFELETFHTPPASLVGGIDRTLAATAGAEAA